MAVKIFVCYAHEDEDLLKKLKSHLQPFQRQGLIELWHDREITAGKEWKREIDLQLNNAQIILILVSPDFMASDYCYGIEMKRAMEKHEHGEAQVIPIILRHVTWQTTPLGKLQALPTDAEPITSSTWQSIDEALLDVAKGLQKVINELSKNAKSTIQQGITFGKLQNRTHQNKSRQESLIDILSIIAETSNSFVEKVFILGCPGSGKTTSAQYIQKYLKKYSQEHLHVVRINDYEFLFNLFKEDEEHLRRFYPTERGGFKVVDPSVFDEVFEKIEEEVTKNTLTLDASTKLFLIEIAHPDHIFAFSHFSQSFLKGAHLLFIDTYEEQCIQRVLKRSIDNQVSLDDYFVPEDILRNFYFKNDLRYLASFLEGGFFSKNNIFITIQNNGSLKELYDEVSSFASNVIFEE
ncbi:MAG TPA: TIR domain-containing protein, partial [Methylomirabilota bacterium]|nr:TIR domain-containing protein [Methylomirabilota bacterium]